MDPGAGLPAEEEVANLCSFRSFNIVRIPEYVGFQTVNIVSGLTVYKRGVKHYYGDKE